MNFFVVPRTFFSFGSKKALRLVSNCLISSSRFARIRALHVSQHPRGTNNNMADGSTVEEYSKRAKIAVNFYSKKFFSYIMCCCDMCFAHIFFQEDEIVNLKRKIEALQNSIGSGSELEDGENEGASNPELEKLLTENSKLKYQMATLKRVRGFTPN